MKLGDRVFYDIESARQDWLSAWYSVPYWGLTIGVGVLCVFAYRTPLTSKLYKESLYSFAIGCTLASAYPHYYKTIYNEKVSRSYFWLKAKFERFPELNIPDGDNVNKNFGMSKWNEGDVEGEEDMMVINSEELFEGDENSHRR